LASVIQEAGVELVWNVTKSDFKKMFAHLSVVASSAWACGLELSGTTIHPW
jgi:hypothetical protein